MKASICLLFAMMLPSLDSPKVQTSERVHFPSSGDVTVSAISKQGGLPHLIFRSPESTQYLLTSNIGSGTDWTNPIVTPDPGYIASKLSFIVLHRTGLPDPLIVALAMSPGGSDCRYRVALFGEVQGYITKLTPELHDHYTRGGDLLAKDAKDDWTLTSYSERYQATDVHVDGPSRMGVFIYSYDQSQGRFIERNHHETRGVSLSESDTDLMRLFGDFAQC